MNELVEEPNSWPGIIRIKDPQLIDCDYLNDTNDAGF